MQDSRHLAQQIPGSAERYSLQDNHSAAAADAAAADAAADAAVGHVTLALNLILNRFQVLPFGNPSDDQDDPTHPSFSQGPRSQLQRSLEL